MARRLNWLLDPEGGSDQQFLSPLLRRLLMEMCTDSPAQMEIPEGIDLRTLDGYSRSRTTALSVSMT